MTQFVRRIFNIHIKAWVHRDAEFFMYFLSRKLLNLEHHFIELPKKFTMREISDVNVTKYYIHYVL
jgi:hypothetical protein